MRVDGSDLEYPVVDGIVNFCPGAVDKVSKAYDKIADRHDATLTHPRKLTRICNTVVWGFSDDNTYADTIRPKIKNGLSPCFVTLWQEVHIYRSDFDWTESR